MNKNKKKVLLLGISIVLVIGLLVSVSYAYWKFTASGQANVVVSKCFQLTFLEEENTNIELLNAYPALLRLLIDVLENAVQFYAEIIENYQKDEHAIHNVFGCNTSEFLRL